LGANVVGGGKLRPDQGSNLLNIIRMLIPTELSGPTYPVPVGFYIYYKKKSYYNIHVHTKLTEALYIASSFT